MSDRREITIGALRLVGETRENGTIRVQIHGIHSTAGAIASFRLYPAEWQSLLAVSALIEAAREWKDVNTGMHTNGPQHSLAMRDTRTALLAAIDALTATDGTESP